ncbi:MAG: hypothetical protein KatS3mg032_1197 [Cyclobacteriaceae bacterium]|nr:MAG: hypothetical protein KatS3mg032_1197 [Cyclobacteriaceae bacterium]
MKNRALILTFLVLLVAAGSVYVYTARFTKSKLNIWNIIPQQAIAVFEPGSCPACADAITTNSLWNIFYPLLFHRQRADNLTTAVLQQITRGEGWIISMHVTSKNDFDFVFYWPAGTAITDWLPAKQIRVTERQYQGVPIKEYRWNEHSFSVITLQNIHAGSFTPYLVEDVIRTYASEGRQAFSALAAPLAGIPRVQRDAGNLFINMQAAAMWLNCFPEQLLRILPAGKVAALDIRQTNESLTLNGFTLPAGQADYLLAFQSSRPVAFSHKSWVSNRSLVVFHQATTGGVDFFEAHYQQHKQALDSLSQLTGTDLMELYAGLGPELSVCLLEKPSGPFTRVVLFDAAKPELWFNMLDKLSNAAEREDTLYAERYGNYLLREIKIPEVPARLFGSLASGFARTYFARFEKTFVMAPSPVVLKQFLDDIERELVLGKSLAFNEFLETTLLESSFSIYVNGAEVLGLVAPYLAKPWQEWYRSHQRACAEWGFSSLQFSHLNNSFYTQLSVTSITGKKSAPAAQSPVMQVRMPAGLYPLVFTAENHLTRQHDIVVQDSAGTLRYLTPDGKEQWNLPVKEQVVFANRQVDFFANGKLQLAFATPGRLHVVDRLGNYVSPYPVQIPVQRPEFFEVVDYDNSKRYRFLITGEEGDIWMFDKQGVNLEGWKPMRAGDRLCAPARHYRIHGKDFIVAVRRDGRALVYNRRGEVLKGFPLDLNARPAGDVYLEMGTGVSNSVFVCISRDGVKTGFRADGTMAMREPLVKTTVHDRFWLVSESAGKGYIIVRQSPLRLSLLSENGTEVVANDFVGNHAVKVMYFNLGSGRIFYTITDQVQQLTYLYDARGMQLTAVPMQAGAVALNNDALPRIVTLYANTVIIESR